MSDSGEREKPREPARVDPDALTRSIPPEALRAADVGVHELEPGAVFGRYVIVGVIGRGGMGVVYRARQDRPQREVALKLIRPGWMSASLLRRFEFEAELLGRLKHPGIAQVYEAGVDAATGTPYFAMELVEGVPLTNYANQRGLNLRQRLELFAKVCDAVQHAHARGVIHRDLKPGNILVADMGDPPEPQPKVLDFGVARATDADIAATTVETAIGALIGTVPYMSPEQVSGDPAELDTRSDVYALGVVLYELLAGRLPYALERRMIHEAVRVIREDEPTRLSSIDRVFRGDVETIVGRSMEKEKERRYQTAAELGTDIRRYLRDEPIAARPPSAAYQLRKFARRNKALVGGVCATFVVLVLGIVGTSTFALRAEARRVEAVDAQTRAERAEADAEQRADELEQVAAFQERQLSEIDAELMGVRLRRDLIERRRGVLESRRLEETEIQAALEEFERSLAGINFTDASLTTLDENVFEGALKTIADGFENQPLVKARLLQAVAITLRELGLLDRATAPQEEALDIRRRVLGDEHPDTLASINYMGILLEIVGRNEEAIPYLREAMEVSRRVLGNEHPDTLASISNMGVLLESVGRYEEAMPYVHEAVETRRRVLGDEHQHTLASINNMGVLLESMGRYEEAMQYLREALEISRRVLGDEHPDTLTSIHNMGSLLLRMGSYEEAMPYLREALEMSRRVLGDEHPNTLSRTSNVGFLFDRMGRSEEAMPYYREALAGFRHVLGDEHPYTLTLIHNTGSLLEGMGRFEEAMPYLREALEKSRRVLGDDHPDTLNSIGKMGGLLRDLGRLDEAESLGAEAVETAKRVLPEGHWYTAGFLVQHARTLAAMERFAEAEERYLEAHSMFEAALGPEHERTISIIRRLADLYDAWHAAEPDAGHDAKAAEWRSRLDEITGEGDDGSTGEEQENGGE
ncbi:MAG: tetratricopeptide repeat protein [Phycisphaeraceae bacterium]|nr:tetratricopeptide repeat protein [Phycisphaeraceae bacterium]